MIQFAEESMRAEIKALWQVCFGDSNEYVDLYLDNHDITRHTMVFIDGAHPVSMLSLLPMTVVTQAGMTLNGRYIYAVATDPRYRGRGISSKLLEAAHKQLKTMGVRLSVLVPANAPLYNFYLKRGFETEFYAGKAIVDASNIPAFQDSFAISEASAGEFMAIRERAFAGRTMFVRWDGDSLAYRMSEIAFGGGETLTLQTGLSRAIAVCVNQGDCVTIKELALDGMDVITALSILQQKYAANEYRLSLPLDVKLPFATKCVPSGAVYWYNSDFKQMVHAATGSAPYISLVLD